MDADPFAIVAAPIRRRARTVRPGEEHPPGGGGSDARTAAGAFRVSVQSDWLDAWIVASGRWDREASAEFASAFEQAMRSGPRKLHVVLRGVTAIDRTEIASLARSKAEARRQGSKVVIHRPSRSVQRALEEAGIRRRLLSLQPPVLSLGRTPQAGQARPRMTG